MTLLGRRVFVVGQDPVDDGVQRAEHRRGFRLAARVGFRLRVGEDLANLASGVPEGAGDLANRHAVAMREANLGVVVHRQHPCLRSLGSRGDRAYWNGCGWGGSILHADFRPGGGSLLCAHNQNWATTRLRPGRLPSALTMSRRVDRVGVGLLWRAVEQRLRDLSGHNRPSSPFWMASRCR